MTKNKEQTLPKWFKGEVYSEGLIVENIFSKEEYELNNIELSMYDFIMGSQLMMEALPKMVTEKQINEFHKGISWFRKTNVNAYYALLD
jgi:hypothetical protein